VASGQSLLLSHRSTPKVKAPALSCRGFSHRLALEAGTTALFMQFLLERHANLPDRETISVPMT
jgi:hypothetical protein